MLMVGASSFFESCTFNNWGKRRICYTYFLKNTSNYGVWSLEERYDIIGTVSFLKENSWFIFLGTKVENRFATFLEIFGN